MPTNTKYGTSICVRFLGLAIAGLIFAQPAAAPPSRPVAVISHMVGDAYLVIPHVRGERPVSILSELRPGQVLRLEPGCHLTIVFVSGELVVDLDGGGRFSVGAEGVEPLDRGGISRVRQRDVSLRMLS